MDWQTISAIVGIAATGAAGVGVFVKKVLPFIRKVSHFIDDMLGEEERPGVPAQPGVIARLSTIEHELHPNGGGSMRDQTNRLEDKFGRLEQKLDDHLTKCQPPVTTTINVNGGQP
jgi:hypothetical protein